MCTSHPRVLLHSPRFRPLFWHTLFSCNCVRVRVRAWRVRCEVATHTLALLHTIHVLGWIMFLLSARTASIFSYEDVKYENGYAYCVYVVHGAHHFAVLSFF